MTLRITVEDLETGDKSAMEIADGDYFLVTHYPCHLAHAASHPKTGTHVLTIKGWCPAAPSKAVEP